MKVEKRNSSKERLVLTSMIVHDQVLADIAPKWDKEGLFRSPWSNLIGDWCVKFINKYGKAPGKNIEGLFRSWADAAADKDLIATIEKFLGQLSGSYQRRKRDINVPYVLDLAGKHFNEVRVKRLAHQLNGDVDSNRLDQAFKRLGKWDQVKVGTEAEVNVLQDKQAWDTTFNQKTEPILKLSGAIGQLIGSRFERDGFIGIMGMEKVGKSYWMQWFAYRALLQRRRVLYYQIGDLSKNQQLIRLGVMFTGKPIEPCTVKIPREVKRDDGIQIKYKTRKFKHGMTKKEVFEALERIQRQQIRSKEPYLKLFCHPMNSVGISEIKASIQHQVRKNWVPDLVVIDYADLLAPAPGYTESRDQINHNWKEMRRMSQEFHNLVITGTQIKAEGYKAATLDMSHFSEDKRKFAHVTGMLSLNQTDEEKDQGITRIGWTTLREGGFSRRKLVTCVGSLAIANPCIRSTW